MSAVKGLMMDVEDFVYDFYTKEGVMLDSPKNIIDKAIAKFGYSFGSYAAEVINQSEEQNGGSWAWEKNAQ
mgnify:CR=1 FL=1|jgi:hypothetical protein|tara:strand:- start:358 stop:570 length:213 start_codon:yes stop_codon:yes gene_type:complete